MRQGFNLAILTLAAITIWGAIRAAIIAISLDPSGVGAVSTISGFVTICVILLAAIAHVLLRRAARRGVVRRTMIWIPLAMAVLMVTIVLGTDRWIWDAAMTEPDYGTSIEAMNAEIERLHAMYWTAI